MWNPDGRHQISGMARRARSLSPRGPADPCGTGDQRSLAESRGALDADRQISDVAWLIVATPLFALALAPAVSWLGQRRWIVLSGLTPVAVLVLLNSSATTALWVNQAVGMVWTGTQTTVDGTDLLALPAVLLPMWLLRRPTPKPGVVTKPARQVTPILVVGIAVLPTTATSCGLDAPGIVSVGLDAGQPVAISGEGQVWRSGDAGTSWQPTDASVTDPNMVACAADESCYRVDTQADALLRETDGTSEVVWQLPAGRREVADRQYERRGTCGGKHRISGAATVIDDPGQQDGHVVVMARGVDGVLVGNPSNGFERVGVGQSTPVPLRTVSSVAIAEELSIASWLAIGLLLVTSVVHAVRVWRRRAKGERRGWVVFATVVIAVPILVGLPVLAVVGISDGPQEVVFAGVAVACCLAAWLAWRAAAGTRTGRLMAGRGLAVLGAVTVPFLLWSVGVVPYVAAMGLAIVFAVVAIVGPPLLWPLPTQNDR